MACCGTTTNTTCNPCRNTCGRRENSFLIILVLYILLAILVSSCMC